MLKISVLIPTWKRPEKLKNCLEHLKAQSLAPFEIVVVVREIDADSIAIIKSYQQEMPYLKYTFTYDVGVVAAENAGLRFISGDIVSFIDDDGYAPIDWVYKIDKFFKENAHASAYGGSDLIKSEPWTYNDFEVEQVGILTWYGKIIGNHHRKALGSLRRVHVLKGVNMSFRRDTFELLDEKLTGKEGHLGNGSQWELDLCLRVLNSGGEIYFDPNLVVIHDSDHSQHNHLIAAKNNTHNFTYVMLKNLPIEKKLIFLIYSIFIGNAQSPGLIKLVLDLIKERNTNPFKFFNNKVIGFLLGIKTYLS